jgi:Ca2+-binding RTX toxin-like protein
LKINGTTDQVSIGSWFYRDVYRIEQFQFADGTTLDKTQLQALVSDLPILGTPTADHLWGDESANTFNGGAGNDNLQGGAGNDTYVFNLGDGQDVIAEYDVTVGNMDTLRFGDGITQADINFARSGGDLVLSINGTTDQVRIQNWGSGAGYRIEQVQFADGATWGNEQLQTAWSSIPIVGTAAADYLYGDEFANTLNGGKGDDYLYGGGGNDTYVFNLGDGQDTIAEYDGTAGNIDTLRFGDGIAEADISLARSVNDLVISINGTTDQIRIQSWGYGDYYRIEQIQFADGTVWDKAKLQATWSGIPIVGTAATDNLSGDDFANTLIGGKGNDNLQGGAGNDTYVFNLGDGQDAIAEYDGTVGNMDTLRFGDGITQADINFARSGSDLVLSISGTNDQVRIQNWAYSDYYRIEQVQFADGAVWNAQYLQQHFSALPVVGTSNDETLYGDELSNTLIGNSGNDYLQGGAGNDTYVFNLGDGQDVIVEADGTVGNIDTLRFGAGIAEADINFARGGNDLVLSINGTTDQVRFQNWGLGDYYRVEQVQFADGTTWDQAQLQTSWSSTPIVGTADADYLYGDEFANTLNGGVGNDNLQGGAGNDTYVFNLGDGQDVIVETDGNAGNIDTLRFGAGIAEADINFTLSGDDLVLSINGTTDQVRIQNWVYGDYYRIEQVQFADGTTWNAQNLHQHFSAIPLVGTSNDDTLTGNEFSNTLVGNAGNDFLVGGEGNDTYLFNLGDGQDTIVERDSTAGNIDTLQFGQGISAGDIGFARSGSDLVLNVNGTTDQVLIQSWGIDGFYRIENVVFAVAHRSVAWRLHRWDSRK